MNPQQQLAFIKSKCHLANPHLKNMEKVCSNCKREVITTGNRIVRQRPITLPDVLLAIWKKDPANRTNVIVESSGTFIVTNWKEGGKKSIGADWNLLLPLDGQSEEVWAFLTELLHD